MTLGAVYRHFCDQMAGGFVTETPGLLLKLMFSTTTVSASKFAYWLGKLIDV